MRVLFIAGERPTYVRNSVILRGIKENGIEVIDCTSNLGSYFLRYPVVMLRFILNRKDYDIVFVGHLGHPLVLFIKIFTNKPIIFDAFLSIYDTLCFERKKFKPDSIFGKLCYWVDKNSCKLANQVILDTNAHINYFVDTFDLPREKFHRVFVGVDEDIFYPRNSIKSEKTTVFYYGTYRPLQGIEYIIKAAKLLEEYKDIEFILVGSGPERKKINKLAQELNIKNIRFIDWLPYSELPIVIARSDICLGGHFSNLDKSRRVIAGKTFQFIAMKKAVIIGDNPANNELFQHKQNAYFVNMANSNALAKSILELYSNKKLRDDIAETSYKTFIKSCSIIKIAIELKMIMDKYSKIRVSSDGLKVAVIAELLGSDNQGGRDISTLYLVKSLNELGIYAHLYSFNSEIKTSIPSKLRSLPLIRALFFFPFIGKKLLKNIENDYDIIHITSTSTAALYKPKVPLVITCHNIITQKFGHLSKLPRIGFLFNHYTQKLFEIVERRNFNNLDRAIVINIRMKEFLKNEFKVPEGKIFFIPNGVDTNLFSPTNRTEDIVLFVGRCTVAKGFDIILKAREKIKARILVVTNKIDSEYLKTGKKLGIEFQFNLSHKQLSKIYGISKVFILPSRDEEQPLTILEAMASGLPVITTKIGAADLIIDRINGFIIEESPDDLADKVNFLLDDTQLSQQMGQKNRQIAERYSWNNVAKETLNVYKNILNKIN